MRIGIVVDDFPSIDGNPIFYEMIGLLERGHEIEVFASTIRQEEQVLQEHVRAYDLLSRARQIMPQSHFRRIWGALRLAVKFACRDAGILSAVCSGGAWREIPVLIERLFLCDIFWAAGFDVIHCQNGYNGKKTVFLKSLLPVQHVTTFRGYDFKPDDLGYFYRELFKEGDVILTVCHKFKDVLSRAGCPEEKILVQYSGIDPDFFEFRPRDFCFEKKIRILSCARMVEKKGLKYAVTAVAELSRKYSNIEYVLIGQGEQRSHLESLAAQMGIGHIVKFIDFLSHSLLKAYFESADIFVLPSIKGADGNVEGIPNVLKEAMASGLVAVSTFHSGIPELITDSDTGFLVPPGDSRPLAEKIEQIIQHPEICGPVAARARAKVSKDFDYRKLTDGLNRLYQRQ